MAYTEKTQNYKLPQWQAGDKPGRQDYNEAFASVDAALANKANKIITSMPLQDIAVAGYVAIGTYWRSDSGLAGIDGFLRKESGFISDWEQLLILPNGFRPATYPERPANYSANSGSIYYAGSMTFSSAGIISSRFTAGTPSNITYCFFNITYQAQ